ncbi:hypothetical protein VNI00_011581 [Paramarasmius palmivorus]|uniref:Zn(2)-C6 fungal-type domain-containing protein n=1 Tax=Paramarasmius palmivorus TaxID=297713 RepID=A0AAW0CCC9_9AGAR
MGAVKSCLKALCCCGPGEDTAANNSRETEQAQGGGSEGVDGSRIEKVSDLGEKWVTGTENLHRTPPAAPSAAEMGTDIDTGGVELGKPNATPPQDEFGNGNSTKIPNGTTVVVSSDPPNPEPSREVKDSMSILSGASDTKISGGQFINVNGSMVMWVHHTNNSPLIPLGAPAYPSGGNDIQQAQPTDSEVYAWHLLPKANGYPLWKPNADTAHIGDVGYMDTDGGFQYLFNILLPADHIRNGPNCVPRHFEPLYVHDLPRNTKQTHQYRPGTLVHNPPVEVQRILSDDIEDLSERQEIYSRLQKGDIPKEVSYGSRITSKHSDGALLLLPDGASRNDYLNEDLFEDYARENAISWYTYVNGDLGRCVGGNALTLVTGVDNAKTWGVATFSRSLPDTVHSMDFVPGIQTATKYWFQTYRSAIVDAGPVQPHDELDQCVFIRGFRVSVREYDGHVEMKKWKRLPNSEIMSIVETIPFRHRRRSIPSKEQSQVELDDSEQVRHGNAKPLPVKLPYHPLAVINDYLLRTNPQVDVALTHDKHWFPLGSMPSNEELISRMREEFELTFPGGTSRAKLVPKGDSNQAGGDSPGKPMQEEVEDDSPLDSASPIKMADSESPLLPTEREQRPPNRVGSTTNGKNSPQQPKHVGPAFSEPVSDALLADAISELPSTITIPAIGNSALSKPCRPCSQHDLECDKVMPVCENCRRTERECNYSNNGADSEDDK